MSLLRRLLQPGPRRPRHRPSQIRTILIAGVDVSLRRQISQRSLTASILTRSQRNDKVSSFITLISQSPDRIQRISTNLIQGAFFRIWETRVSIINLATIAVMKDFMRSNVLAPKSVSVVSSGQGPKSRPGHQLRRLRLPPLYPLPCP